MKNIYETCSSLLVRSKEYTSYMSVYNILQIQLPVNPATNKAKGFAFIEFDNKNTALGAIQVISIHREINNFGRNSTILNSRGEVFFSI